VLLDPVLVVEDDELLVLVVDCVTVEVDMCVRDTISTKGASNLEIAK
jgi:hypothetical protein